MGNTRLPLIPADHECLENFENFILLTRMPWELGLTDQPYKEDIEGIKEMKRWQIHKANQDQEREQRRAGLRDRASQAFGGT